MEKSESKFLPVTDDVVKIIYNRNKAKIDNDEVSFTIDPSWYVLNSSKEKNFDDTFICSICHLVVIDPIECEKCEKVYCSKCIKFW